MPAISRIGDPVSCGDTLAQGSGNTFCNGIPVTRVGPDLTAGHCFNPTPITSGSTTTFVNDLPVVRVGDPILVHCCGPVCHGGVVANGSPDVSVDS